MILPVAESIRVIFLFFFFFLQGSSQVASGTAEAPLSKQCATIPGKVTAPYPTVSNLAVEWYIEGDDNLNGQVEVNYRRTGEERWRQAMPLRRVPTGRSRGTRPIFIWRNKHSGSIFDLQPGTEYEIMLNLTDPDGGSATRTIRVRTRPVPKAVGNIINCPPGEHGILQTTSGRPGMPNVYVCRDGKAVYKQIDLRNRRWVYIEGLHVKNQEEGRASKGILMDGAEWCVVRRCRIDAVYGIVADKPGAKNCYISDNVVTGTTPWTNEAMGARGKNIGEGIQITGPGNVICFNRVSGFRDAISTMEDRRVVEQTCIDIYNNDIYVGADDGIEADFCMHNCRVIRNRLTNCFVGLSSQPGLGGPTYFIRNVMYNLTYVPFKLHRFSVGDILLHNSVVKVGAGLCCFSRQPFDFALFRNNLAIGGPTTVRWGGYGAGNGNGAQISAHGPNCSFDFDAVGSMTGSAGTIGEESFSVAEPNGLIIDMTVFESVEFPSDPLPGYEPPKLYPRPGSIIVDRAVLIPNINEDYMGRAPDIGAYELGRELPSYGPRSPGIDEDTEFVKRTRSLAPPGIH